MRLGLAFSASLLFLAACESSPKAATPAPDTKEVMRTEDAPAAPPTSMHDLMLAKTAWAAALLESISMRDYERVETNADALRRVSLDTAFIVQDTVTYRAYSDSFRKAVSQLAVDARARDQPAIETDYHHVTEACFRCHQYVHAERLHDPMPGKVSLR